MKVIVLGSGIIGVTTAYYLARQGHEVQVVDRQPEAARETSYANAGQISPGYSSPWAAPGIPLKAIKWLFSNYSPLVIRPTADPKQWLWMAQMLANCTAGAYAVNKARMLRLASYSRECFAALRAETGIRYDERTQGTLQLFRTQKQVDDAARDITILEQCGVPYELLDPAGCVAAEPALGLVTGKIAGGLRLPDDETGDCFQFARQLATRAAGMGVKFDYGTAILGLATAGGRIAGVDTAAGRLQADSYVMALGSYSPQLLAPLGIRIPVYPVKGYSITVPISDAVGAPVSTVMDETHKVAVTRLGDRIRAAGTAELAGYDLRLRESRRKTVDHVVRDLFPTGGDVAEGEFWCGLRPMTPDGTPIVGATAIPNLYLNTGHGTLGWTMSCGSGRLLSDIISGRTPEIRTDGLGLERYRRKPRPARARGGHVPAH